MGLSTCKRCEITNDPNRDDDPEYILRLIGQVITVSLETVNALPDLGLPQRALLRRLLPFSQFSVATRIRAALRDCGARKRFFSSFPSAYALG